MTNIALDAALIWKVVGFLITCGFGFSFKVIWGTVKNNEQEIKEVKRKNVDLELSQGKMITEKESDRKMEELRREFSEDLKSLKVDLQESHRQLIVDLKEDGRERDKLMIEGVRREIDNILQAINKG